MLMFYKEDGSYDVKAFYEHRLIDEYQEEYGVGEDIGEARGLKIVAKWYVYRRHSKCSKHFD